MSEGTYYWGAEGILCQVMKLKYLIVAKDRESGNMLSQENFEFLPISVYILGHFASDMCNNKFFLVAEKAINNW